MEHPRLDRLGADSSDRLASDTRVRQFWDPGHEISNALRQMASSMPSEPRPNSGKGFYWDQALLYPAHAQWTNAKPVFWQGPVFRVIDGLQEAIKDAVRNSAAATKQ
jgi:hypothetical protein